MGKKAKTYTYIIEKPGKIEVSIKVEQKLKSLSSLFYVLSIDLSKIKIDLFKNISRLFVDCESLQNITCGESIKNITYMDEAFPGFSSLEVLDLSLFNTESMAGLFSRCHSLKSLDIEHFNNIKVTSMEVMFSGCDLS